MQITFSLVPSCFEDTDSALMRRRALDCTNLLDSASNKSNPVLCPRFHSVSAEAHSCSSTSILMSPFLNTKVATTKAVIMNTATRIHRQELSSRHHVTFSKTKLRIDIIQLDAVPGIEVDGEECSTLSFHAFKELSSS